MISFSCPRCTKALLAANREAGRPWTCPRCGEALTVPAPPPGRSAARSYALPLLGLLAAAVVGGALVYQYLRPTLRRGRAPAAVYALSARWRQVEWPRWEPGHRTYRLTAWYSGDRKPYFFEVSGLPGEQQVQVRPDPDARRRLAFGSFHEG